MSITFEDLREGLSVDDAIRAFTDGCKKPGRLWITDSWIQPRLERLKDCLTGPLTKEQAKMLRAVALKQVKFDPVLDWLSQAPDIPWDSYSKMKQDERERELAPLRERKAKLDYAEWECLSDPSRVEQVIRDWYPKDPPQLRIIIEETTEKTPKNSMPRRQRPAPPAASDLRL